MTTDTTPDQLAELRQLAERRRSAWEALDRATWELRAAVLTALGNGLPEAAAAREAGVDRMTVRTWSGKR